MNMKREAN